MMKARREAGKESLNFWTVVMSQRLDDAENTRSMLICRAMLARGHKVTMWTSAWDHIHKRWRDEGRESYVDEYGMVVRFIRGTGYTKNIHPSRYRDHLLAARDFLKKARSQPKPDIILGNIADHFTAFAVAKYATSTNIPYVIDVRDKWPDTLYDHISNPLFRVIAKVAFAYDSWKCSFALKHANAIVAMLESFVVWGLKRAKRPRTDLDRLYYLNTSGNIFDGPPPKLPDGNKCKQTIEELSGVFKALYVGTFNRSQNPEILLDAIDYIESNKMLNDDEYGVLIGGGGLNEEIIEERCRVYKNVKYLGWLSAKEIEYLCYNSTVGIVPSRVDTEAFSNKTFSYLGGGRPLVSNPSGELRTLINEHEIGVNFDVTSSVSLAKQLVYLARNPDSVSRLENNVREFFRANLDRDRTYNEYADLLEGLGRKHVA